MSAVLRKPRLRIGAVVVVALAAGLVVWLLVRGDGDSTGAVAKSSSASAMTTAELGRLATSIRHPVYWLGPKPGFTYEVTLTRDGRIYVRYLPTGVSVGADKPYLTVATYPFPGSYAAIRKQARTKGAVSAKLAAGGLALLDRGYPESVHVAYPGVEYQIEVFDPTPARAMQLVSGGELAGLGASTAGRSAGPEAASPSDLESLVAELGHPVYWAGPRRRYTYELTRTSSGSVYIRYLPPGVRVGDPRPLYVTVATYPFPNAFAVVKRTAKPYATIKLAQGGIGVVDGAYTRSIHIAYPGVNYQVEVYDPSPRAGRKLVAAGRITRMP
jgi:hypothetical protein